MIEITKIIWLFPILFMIHDFEEIIFIKQWKKKEYYKNLKVKPFSNFISTASFSVAVAQEFIIFSIVTFISALLNNYLLWFGLFSAIVIHYFIHCVISLNIKKYHPGLITSIIFFPIGIYLLYISAISLNFSLSTIVITTVIGLIILLGNLRFLHIAMPVFEKIIKSI